MPNTIQPLVSIIIPVYNGSNFLAEAIDSALAQTYKNFEIIVVNDGSTDNGKTEDVAKSYGSKIRYFYKANGGVSTALNFGIQKMHGSWFSWLSHDDLYYPDKIERQINYIKQHPNARFIISPYKNIDKNGKDHKSGICDWKKSNIPQFRQILTGDGFSGCALLIHKSCFDKVGLFNEQNHTSQDIEMWLRMSLTIPFGYCAGIVLKRRVHDEMGSIVDKQKNRADVSDMLSRVLLEVPIENIFSDKLSYLPSKDDLAKCHTELGDILNNLWLPHLAYKEFNKSYSIWPSLLNPALYRLIIGGSLSFQFKKIVRLYWNMIEFKYRIQKKYTRS